MFEEFEMRENFKTAVKQKIELALKMGLKYGAIPFWEVTNKEFSDSQKDAKEVQRYLSWAKQDYPAINFDVDYLPSRGWGLEPYLMWSPSELPWLFHVPNARIKFDI